MKVPAYQAKSVFVTSTSTELLALPKPYQAPAVALAHAWQDAFDYFSHALFAKVFGQPLPHLVLNMSRKRGALAYFQANVWKDHKGENHSEISINPEANSARDERDVLSTLVHEMAHFLDHLDGTSCKGGYHGKSWFRIMAQLGLQGRALSSSMQKVTHDIIEDGPFAIAFANMPSTIGMPFQAAYGTRGVAPRKPTAMGMRARHQCPVCQEIARGRFSANFVCGQCNEPMHVIDAVPAGYKPRKGVQTGTSSTKGTGV